ncbi:SH3 domain-containing protein [Thermospira aquatica]|uniref:SH3 domain-containing protein n=1 Tax=Thermospira aquatica TaxID=2828656 RepID=A0AAX3BEK2_9SPIR|nr:SH3 domain-containing protein [Thermospira aquatica]URA10665.1 SH3 domain-containing protein [Thermospira aquatica]
MVEDTIIYNEPNINSKVIRSLNITEIVLIESNVMVTNAEGTKEKWLFIKTLGGKKGWIQRNTIAKPTDFKQVKKFGDYYIEGWSGDYDFAYRFYRNGTYKMKVFDDIKEKTIYKIGRLYRCKNIVATEGGALFYFDEEGNLFTDVLFIDDKTGEPFRAITNKSEFPKWAQSDKAPVLETYYILTGDNVNVRSEASTNSAVLLKLKKGARVKLLERSDVTFTIGDRTGNWVYIDTGVKDKKGNTIKGWVVDIYLKEE